MVRDPWDDKPKEECGLFGIYAPELEVARLTYYGLYALQHRGQESAGIAVSDGEVIDTHKGMGLVSEVFSESIVNEMKGKIAIGHVRYSTAGSNLITNAQPLAMYFRRGMMALGLNGSLANSAELRKELGHNGALFQTTVDTEIIINLIARYYRGCIEDAIIKTMLDLRGGYALVLIADNRLIGVRDPYGVRPLCIGKINGRYCLASESCALDTIGAELVRDVEPGEIVVIDEEGLHSRQGLEPRRSAGCSFEYIYFARPDSTIDGINVTESRKKMGIELAKEYPVDADIVIPVPDSGTTAALGYSEASGIPFAQGLLKNRYIGRTFIKPTQEMRELAVRLKLNANATVIKGKRVAMIDDSIVRGTTSTRLVEMVRKAGAKEVHLLICSPPVTHPCYYGIDTAEREKLIATQLDVEGIRKYVGADSLYYLSSEGIIRALGGRPLCLACFNGDYPAGVPGECSFAK